MCLWSEILCWLPTHLECRIGNPLRSRSCHSGINTARRMETDVLTAPSRATVGYAAHLVSPAGGNRCRLEKRRTECPSRGRLCRLLTEHTASLRYLVVRHRKSRYNSFRSGSKPNRFAHSVGQHRVPSIGIVPDEFFFRSRIKSCRFLSLQFLR